MGLPRHEVAVLLLSLFAACTGPDAASDTGSAGTTTPYVFEDTGTPSPQLTAEEAATAIDAIFQDAVSYNGNVLFEAYDEVMEYGDDACPKVDSSEDGGSMWDTDCTATSGASFTGFISVFEGMQGTQYNSNMRGESTVSLPDGSTLVVAGDAHTTIDEVNLYWASTVDGVMYYDGPAGDGTWVEVSPDVRMDYKLVSDADGNLVEIDMSGAVGSLEGAVSAVSLTDIVIAGQPSFPCPDEPSGTVAVRDANGLWMEIIFDVDVDAEAASGYAIDDGECDGCGTMWYDGESLGQVCVHPLTALEAPLPPW